MATYRIERLNREFLRLLAGMLGTEIKNDLAASAVLTEVDTSRDLSSAKVFFTVIDEGKRGSVLAALDSVKGKMRGLLGKQMKIRHVPELRFIYDESELRGRRMDAILDRVIEADNALRRPEAIEGGNDEA